MITNSMATKRKKSILEEVKDTLTFKQALFCELFCFDQWCFCNATVAYMKAYGMKESQRKSAQVNGAKLLSNTIIRKYVNSLIDEHFDNKNFDRRLTSLAFQNKNLVVSLGAVQEYNKLKKRIEEKDINLGPVTYMWTGDERPAAPFKVTKESQPTDKKNVSFKGLQ